MIVKETVRLFDIYIYIYMLDIQMTKLLFILLFCAEIK